MIDAIASLANANPVLIGGIGTVAFGSLMYAVKSVPQWLYSTLRRLLTIEITITSEGTLYHELLRVLSARRVGALARLYTTDRQRKLVSGFGTSFALWGRVPVLFEREILERNFQLYEKLTITLFTRSLKVMEEIIAAAEAPPMDNTIPVFIARGGFYDSGNRKRKRSLDTVFVRGTIIPDMVKRIEWFFANEAWYNQRGIPYKLTFLLHGPPGTGKSSLVFAIACHFNKELGVLADTLSSSLDRTLVPATGRDNTFMLIEDIDMLTVARPSDGAPAVAAEGTPPPVKAKKDEDDKAQQLSALHTLINALDGVGTPNGLVMFITTNHKDRLDPALVRSGRIDCDIEVGRLDLAAQRGMFTAFYGAEHAAKLTHAHYFPRTGAELQQILMACPDPAAALNKLREPPAIARAA